MNVKQIIRLGSFFAAWSAILGTSFAAISYAKPIIDSDWPGPFAGQTRVQQCEAKVVQLAQNFMQMQNHQQRSDITQAFLSRGFWEMRLASAQDRLRKHPEDMIARQAALEAQQQLADIDRIIASAPRR